DPGFPGMRFVQLHTIAHLLIRELALDCGYNAASIRERVYADTEDGKSQAGILIYTAAADSDGTLGGLVDLGKPENLGRLLRQARPAARLVAARRLLPRVLVRFRDFVRVRQPLPRPRARRPDAPNRRRSLLHGELMQALLDVVADLVALVSPSKVRTIATALRGLAEPSDAPNVNTLVDTPAARAAVGRVLAAWAPVKASGDEVAGMLLGASEARLRVERELSVELVWTGPTTRFVPTRRTEQVLLDLIASATKDFFLVSFVAYDVASVIAALNDAASRGVRL